jgi:hypothetical protein
MTENTTATVEATVKVEASDQASEGPVSDPFTTNDALEAINHCLGTLAPADALAVAAIALGLVIVNAPGSDRVVSTSTAGQAMGVVYDIISAKFPAEPEQDSTPA